MNQVRIRPAETPDWKILERIFSENRGRETVWLNPERVPDDFRKQCEGERILVAEKALKVIGFLSIWEPEYFIHHLYVTKDFQGIGIGRKLVAEAQKQYKKPLRLKCGEKNTRALEFYYHTGWKEVGAGVSEDGPYLLLEMNMAEQAAGGDATR